MANWCIAKPAVNKKTFDRFADNDPITILYNPNAPKGGIPYAILTEAEVLRSA